MIESSIPLFPVERIANDLGLVEGIAQQRLESHQITHYNRVESNYISQVEAEEICDQLSQGDAIIHFQGRFVRDILQNGYKHWSQLKTSKNTNTASLFIERLQSEAELFGIYAFNHNMFSRAEELYSGDPEEFILIWNSRFNQAFSPTSTLEEIFSETGFYIDEEQNYYGPVFGSIYYDGAPVSTMVNVDMNKIYGHSQLILNRNVLEESATYALGDTFDAFPESYAWHLEGARAVPVGRKYVLFTLGDRENVVNRLISCPRDSLPYIECHFHRKIEVKHIMLINLSRSEIEREGINVDAEVKRIRSMWNISVTIIP